MDEIADENFHFISVGCSFLVHESRHLFAVVTCGDNCNKAAHIANVSYGTVCTHDAAYEGSHANAKIKDS